MLTKLLCLLALAAPLAAQTASMVQVAKENDTVVTSTAVVYVFGALTGTTTQAPIKTCSAITFNCFAPPVTTTGPVTLSVVNGKVDVTDPAFGVGKALYVIPQSFAQSGVTTSAGVKKSWTVPATTTTVTLPSTSVCTQNTATTTVTCTITVSKP